MTVVPYHYSYNQLEELFKDPNERNLVDFKKWIDTLTTDLRAKDVTINWLIDNFPDLTQLDIPPRFVRFEYTVKAEEAPLEVFTLDQAFVSEKILMFMNARVLEPSDYVEEEDENGNRTQIRFLKPPRENNILHGIYIPVS